MDDARPFKSIVSERERTLRNLRRWERRRQLAEWWYRHRVRIMLFALAVYILGSCWAIACVLRGGR